MANRPLPVPTHFLPGTPEKVDVIAKRLERGEELWHPGDAKMDQHSVARVPIVDPGNHKLVGWRIALEQQFRRYLKKRRKEQRRLGIQTEFFGLRPRDIMSA